MYGSSPPPTIETHSTPRSQPAIENLIETRLRAGESVALVVTNKERIACEGKVSADDAKFDWRAPLLRFGLLNLVHARFPRRSARRRTLAAAFPIKTPSLRSQIASGAGGCLSNGLRAQPERPVAAQDCS
jgi:hypothetical protein